MIRDVTYLLVSLALICGTVAAGVSSTAAAATATADQKIGYWWKKEPPSEIIETDPEHPELGPPPTQEVLDAMHPEDFEKLLEDYREYALWKLTPQHVTWYYEMQDHARRKARAFMNVTETVMLNSPELNMNSVYPTSNPGQAARTQQRESSIRNRLAVEREQAALVVLTRQSCAFCEPQLAALKHFQQRHGWQIKQIDLDAEPRAIARFGTDTTPTTIVIFRNSDDWMPVAVGVESVPRIEESVYRAVRLVRGETTAEQFTMQEYQEGTPLDPLRRAPR